MCREADKLITHTFKIDEKEPLKNVERRLERATHDAASLRSLAPARRACEADESLRC